MTLLLYGSHPRGVPPAPGLTHEDAAASLPILTTAGDIREVVRYLQRRPAGVSVAEELDRARKRLFETRRLAAYESLGLVDTDGESVSLSPLGRACAEGMEQETQVFRRLIERTAAYRSALEWFYGQGLDIITTTDLLGFWREHHAEAAGAYDGDLMRGAASSFFSLCQAAGLGTMTLGKRGHLTRLSVDQEELRAFLDGEASAPGVADAGPRRGAGESLRILIVAGSDGDTVGVLRRTLEMVDVECRLSERDWNVEAPFESGTPHPLPDCDAVFIVLDETAFAEDCAGRRSLKEPVLIEIGATLALYDRRVVLLMDKRCAPPEAVRDLHCYELVNGGLTWEAGIRLLEAVGRFKGELGLR